MLLAAGILPGVPLRADRIVLKDGMDLTGSIATTPFQIAVRTSLKTYFVPSELLLHPEGQGATDEPTETFALNAQTPKNGKRIAAVGRLTAVEPFDSFGRRQITLQGLDGREISVLQAITEIYPSHVVLVGLNYSWQTALSLNEIPPSELDGILERLAPRDSLTDQIKVTNFLIQSRRFTAARDRLAQIRTNFPEAESKLIPLEEKLSRQFSDDAFRVAERALAAGQLRKVDTILEELTRVGVPTEHADRWRELGDRRTIERDKLAKGRSAFESALAASTRAKSDAALKAIAEEILAHIGPFTIDRLEPLLSFGADTNVAADDRLGLAISGWVAGPDLAVVDANKVTELAEARWLLQEAVLATSDADFEIALDEVRAKGVTVPLARAILPRLPAPSSEIAPGTLVEITPNEKDATPYLLVLPSEYSPAGQFPLLVSLHGTQSTAEDQIAFWRSSAESLGAVLIAPKYLSGEKRGYEYSLEEHRRFAAILTDARKRFAIDSDRVFLSGHEVGAFAAFDLGMSHPDEFAGVVAVSGLPMFYAQYYWRNITHLPIFVVDGAFNGDNPAILRTHLERWMRDDVPVLYAEYAGRGSGSFEAERPTLVDWMSRRRRDSFPSKIEGSSARHSERRFYWLEIDSFMENTTIPPQLFDKKKGVRPARVRGERTEAGSLSIQTSGLTSLLVHLASPFVPFDDESFAIKVNGKQLHKGKIEPDLADMLREVRRTGDRQRLVMKTLRFKP